MYENKFGIFRLCLQYVNICIFRSDIIIVCKRMQFSRFPLDRHKCLFKLSSCELKILLLFE